MNDSAVPPPLPALKPELSPRYSRLGAALAVCVIISCVVFVVRMQSTHRADCGDEVRPNRMLELMARYTVGVKELLRSMQQSDVELTQTVLQDFTQFSRTNEDALRLLILKGWLMDEWPAAADLDVLAAKNADLQADVVTLQLMKAMNGEVPDEAWKKLRQRHGWMAELARAQTANDAARRVVAQQGIGTAVVLISVSLLGMCAAACGLALLVWGITRWRSGKLCLTLALRSRAEGGVLLEGFAIFLALFLFPPWLLRLLSVPLPGWAAYGPALIALFIGMAWPRVRGMQRSQWREALGLHRGQGLWREMGVGVLCWLASLPLLVLGMIAASWIMKLTGEFPSHPIVEVFAGNGWAKFGAVLLAVVWAPISEEIIFRGLLFPGLSSRLRWLPGAVLGAFVFAVIHPQGWAGVPAIMVLACSFSFLRMWRRSLIAPMTAHALNNGIMCAVMLLLW
ncbi:CPBP family intramembrane glutamic endopeptidase [Prosthecobacter sp.]|uniref:CPBP family intramembrane glutamic endopeptidase n=1 Tax=Prosthecobacter sp. TaxID=1965333 RepID=UPI002489E4AC|nr:CPBP family intramembrane glutamic endopeptidase [Prosthecobacter sp.]MDI1314335.1 lysostaphin resistance A-like protein [Prosthecobacter sp.]